MIVELTHWYDDLETSNFVKECQVEIGENGVWVSVDVRDYEQPEAEYLWFRASVAWEPLMEEALMEVVNACRAGGDGPVQIDQLTELRDEWIATLEGFIERLRALP